MGSSRTKNKFSERLVQQRKLREQMKRIRREREAILCRASQTLYIYNPKSYYYY